MTAARAIAQLLDRGLTKSELAARSGVSRSLIDDYLKGRRQPTVAQLERLGNAAALRLETAWVPAEAHTPRWATPNTQMAAPPLSMPERAQILERVVDLTMALRRRPRGDLQFPPFRSLGGAADRRARSAAGGGRGTPR